MNGMIEYFFDLDVMREVFLKQLFGLMHPHPEYPINPLHGNLDGLDAGPRLLIQVLKAIINLVFLTDLNALIDGEISVAFERLQ
jgi:hypothetical protein